MTERTTAELAALLKLSERRTLELLEESRDLGLVEFVAGRWRLTEHAERELGAAFRGFDNSIDDASTFARPRSPRRVISESEDSEQLPDLAPPLPLEEDAAA